ncbi:transcriptional regulator, XRE family [Kribbella flavida DSM 17836]|uniref:Transcriptional regulator, XRE family n=1 Tax=Kribbella flavida (strain DSM 17836 / JCM 10339 / NBRC 14399) TaxID=479435 RepID=D2PSM9_KRIFD|nr:helix-turn-helix domain-containing protein [Kribbella flavida]ADB33167.1 transcriptional regulator, XRE family [Kribbella flavida DSM 17836]
MRATQSYLGSRLRTLRMQKGLSQKALAGDVVTPSYISLLEAGERMPTLDVILHLARALETTPAELLGDDYRDVFAPNSTATASGSSAVAGQLYARSLVDLGDYAGAREVLERELAQARSRNTGDEILELSLELSRVLAAAGDHSARLALLDEMLAADSTTVPAIRIPVAIDRASTLRELGRFGQSREAAEELLSDDVLGDAALRHERVRLLGVLVSVLCELGELEDVERLTEELRTEAAATGQNAIIGRAHWLTGMALVRLDRRDEAVEELKRAGSLLQFGSMPMLDWLRFCRSTASILLSAGDPESALAWLTTAEAAAGVTDLTSERMALVRVRAEYELAAGNPSEAASLYGQVTEGPEPLTGLPLITALRGQAEALRQSGDIPAAIEVLRRAARLYEDSDSYRQASAVWREIDELRA